MDEFVKKKKRKKGKRQNLKTKQASYNFMELQISPEYSYSFLLSAVILKLIISHCSSASLCPNLEEWPIQNLYMDVHPNFLKMETTKNTIPMLVTNRN